MVVLLTSVPLLFPLSSPITSPPPPALATLQLFLPGVASAAAAWPPRASAPAMAATARLLLALVELRAPLRVAIGDGSGPDLEA